MRSGTGIDNKLYQFLRRIFRKNSMACTPAKAYDRWANTYDEQSGNLMIALDEIIFQTLLKAISLKDKLVADIGCGTGRYWPLLLLQGPAGLCGYDISAGMLKQLKHKYSDATVYQMEDCILPHTNDNTYDVIVSTLALAYFTSLTETFKEWNRVLKKGGDILFTSYHPDTLEHGGSISFSDNHGRVSIQHHIYTLEAIKKEANKYGWEIVAFEERKINDTVKHFYEQKQALHIYEKFKGKSIIYGIHLSKPIIDA